MTDHEQRGCEMTDLNALADKLELAAKGPMGYRTVFSGTLTDCAEALRAAASSQAGVETQGSESQAKATEGKSGMAGVTDPVRRSTAGTGLRVGEASADLPATSEFMDVTAGETATFPSEAPPSQEPVAWRRRRKGIAGTGGWIMCPEYPSRDKEFDLEPLYNTPPAQPAPAQQAVDVEARERIAKIVRTAMIAEPSRVENFKERVDLRREIADKAAAAILSAGLVPDEAARHLGNLLAIIHRDGGHYQTAHGTEKAVSDAHFEWADLVSRAEQFDEARIRADEREKCAKVAENFDHPTTWPGCDSTHELSNLASVVGGETCDAIAEKIREGAK